MGLKPSTFERKKVRTTVLVQVRVCVKRHAFELMQTRSNALVQCSGCVKGAAVELHQGKVGRSAVHGRTYRSTFERLMKA
jgi:hypothetical protein